VAEINNKGNRTNNKGNSPKELIGPANRANPFKQKDHCAASSKILSKTHKA